MLHFIYRLIVDDFSFFSKRIPCAAKGFVLFLWLATRRMRSGARALNLQWVTLLPSILQARYFYCFPFTLCMRLYFSHALFKLLTAALFFIAPAITQAQARIDRIAERTLACTACHGKEGRATSEGFFPRIAGKPAGYLYNQLRHFRDGRRQNPAMAHMVTNLSDAYLKEIADHFAALNPPYPPPQTSKLAPATLERGRQLVFYGDATRDIPACVRCHGDTLTGVLPAIPSLLGLPHDYLNAQFGSWKIGLRHAAAPDCMAQISQALNTDEIAAISSWLAAQPMPRNKRPAPALTRPLPIACGSMPP